MLHRHEITIDRSVGLLEWRLRWKYVPLEASDNPSETGIAAEWELGTGSSHSGSCAGYETHEWDWSWGQRYSSEIRCGKQQDDHWRRCHCIDRTIGAHHRVMCSITEFGSQFEQCGTLLQFVHNPGQGFCVCEPIQDICNLLEQWTLQVGLGTYVTTIPSKALSEVFDTCAALLRAISTPWHYTDQSDRWEMQVLCVRSCQEEFHASLEVDEAGAAYLSIVCRLFFCFLLEVFALQVVILFSWCLYNSWWNIHTNADQLSHLAVQDHDR